LLLLAGCCTGVPFLTGCGGGVPLLYEAHVLPRGTARVGAGLSGTFAAGDASNAMRGARGLAATGADPGRDAAYAAGAAAAIGVEPGVAPWVGGRFGLPGDNEAGLTYTGPTVRVDARHAFQNATTAFSIGPGVSLSSAPENDAAAIPNLEIRARKLGADLPLILGWRSVAGIVSGWAGVRGGFERATGTVSLGGIDPARSGDLSLTRWYAGGVIGLGFGFRHVHAVLELDASYCRVAGTLAGVSAKTTGIALTPSSALLLTF
jgi:hypothetical protein